jgi:uncharacterized membrane protein YqjE
VTEAHPVSTRRALLRHLWAMVQTRAEAATLVVKLQRTAVSQGLLMYGIAAVAAMSFTTALIVLIAVAAPPAWRAPVLALLTVALLATAIYGVVNAGRKLTRDASLIADFTRGLKLDIAMINLALQDAATDDEEKLAKRERTRNAVREAAADKAATPSTAEGGGSPAADGPTLNAAAAAMHAASPATKAGAAGAPESITPAEVAARERELLRQRAAAYEGADRIGNGDTVGETGATAGAGRAYAFGGNARGELPTGITEREMPEPPITTPEAMTVPVTDREQVKHGSA